MFKRIREIITKFSKIIFHTSNIKKIKEAHQETPIFRYIELWQYARNIGAPIPVREIGVAGCNQAEKLINHHNCQRKFKELK